MVWSLIRNFRKAGCGEDVGLPTDFDLKASILIVRRRIGVDRLIIIIIIIIIIIMIIIIIIERLVLRCVSKFSIHLAEPRMRICMGWTWMCKPKSPGPRVVIIAVNDSNNSVRSSKPHLFN